MEESMAARGCKTSEEEEMKAEMEEWKRKFPAFPYKPYSIQIDFMNALYQSLNNGGISMLESPTEYQELWNLIRVVMIHDAGTGKTLSIICSALQWLVDGKKQHNSVSGNRCSSDDEPDWMRNYMVNKENQSQEKKKAWKNHDKVKQGESIMDLFGDKSGDGSVIGNGKRENSRKVGLLESSDEEEFLVEEYESDEKEDIDGGKCKRKANGVCISSSSEEEDDEDGVDRCEDKGGGLKVYFCSRTHSQLSQFVKELRKTVFASELNVVSLGSRKNFCINEEVLKLGNAAHINERCLELQKTKKCEASKIKNLGPRGRVRRTKASSGCSLLRKPKLQKEFRSEVLQQEALDIEDIVHLGSRLGTCPYYGSRSMVPSADLVVLPYQSLLLKSSRESLGLDLKDNVVIIDEAHNLADSLISMYDAKVTFSQLENVHHSLESYLERFCNLLGPGNRRYIQTLMVLTRAFLQVLLHEDETDENATCCDPEKAAEVKPMAINDFLFSLNIDNINFVKLIHYVKESNIIHKVSGYGDKVASFQKRNNLAGETHQAESTLSGFRALVEMLLSLTNKNADGRIILSRTRSKISKQPEGYIKYVMLSGEKIFFEIVNQAHAVILAGGTLQPIEETQERLFPWLPPEKLQLFSCSHIVPPESILPIAVSQGPSGLSFDFSYNSRILPKMMEELGLLLCNLVTVVPEGIVVFFSSFDYEAKVYDAWKVSGILQRIMKKKRLYREPRSSADVEAVLGEYKETIDRLSHLNPSEGQTSQNGAVLLAVVGGKISEGINFSDGMGRCIVVVGLPYPSPSDVELLERIKHMEGLEDTKPNNLSQKPVSNDYDSGDVRAGFDILRRCRRRGKEYYENLCMKAVNQSIGRAIRHINDYAAILLVDSRYATDPLKRSLSHPANKLPKWIKDRLISATGNYGEVHRMVNQFFKYNRKKETTFLNVA
ncbi:hypothetical protein Ancab_012170 [Ancistrocladus abbreviatus]